MYTIRCVISDKLLSFSTDNVNSRERIKFIINKNNNLTLIENDYINVKGKECDLYKLLYDLSIDFEISII